MKDPAALFYIDTWLSATAEMDSDVRGWYLNLILHQYDKKDLPNDIEKLAVLAGVKFSEFERFKHVYEQVLKHKFDENDKGRLENSYAKRILQSRELFKDKRQKAGNIGVVIKMAKDIKGFKDKFLNRLKDDLFDMEIEQIEKHKDKQMLEQMLKLYINENENEDVIKEENIIKYLHPLQKYISDKFPTVSKMEVQLTEENCKKLLEKYSSDQISKTLISMENYKPLLKKSKSVYLTLLTWLSKDFNNSQIKTPEPKGNAQELINTANELIKQLSEDDTE